MDPVSFLCPEFDSKVAFQYIKASRSMALSCNNLENLNRLFPLQWAPLRTTNIFTVSSLYQTAGARQVNYWGLSFIIQSLCSLCQCFSLHGPVITQPVEAHLHLHSWSFPWLQCFPIHAANWISPSIWSLETFIIRYTDHVQSRYHQKARAQVSQLLSFVK